MSKNDKSNWMIHKSNLEDPRYRLMIVVLIGVVATVFYAITYHCALYIHDDIMNYCFAMAGKTASYADAVAKSQGRIMFYPLTFLAHLPFLANNLLVYKLISYASITFSAVCLGVLVYRHVDKALGFVAVLFFFVFAQVSPQHNLFSAYVLTHQIPIGILLLSFERQLTFYKTHKTRTMVVSGILLTLSSMLYEAFILFAFLTFFIAVAYYISQKNKNVLRLMLDLKFHILFMAIYLTTYFVWRIIYPSSYEGNVVSLISIKASLRALLTYSFGLYPLRTFIQLPPGTDWLSAINIFFILKALAAAAALFFLLRKTEKFSAKRLLAICVLCLIGMFIPNILLSLTQKRVEWVLYSGISEYVTSFYSYFFLILMIAVILGFLYSHIRFKRTFLALSMAVIVSVSILTDAANTFNTRPQEMQLYKMEAISAAVQTDYFAAIPENSVIYMPDFVGIHLNMQNMSWLTDIYTRKPYVFTNKAEDLTFAAPTYMIRYDYDAQTIMMGRIDADYTADEIVIVASNPIRTREVLLTQQKAGSIIVDGVAEDCPEQALIASKQANATILDISGTDLCLDKMDVTELPNAA